MCDYVRNELGVTFEDIYDMLVKRLDHLVNYINLSLSEAVYRK